MPRLAKFSPGVSLGTAATHLLTADKYPEMLPLEPETGFRASGVRHCRLGAFDQGWVQESR